MTIGSAIFEGFTVVTDRQADKDSTLLRQYEASS